jgi:hypothetical protein
MRLLTAGCLPVSPAPPFTLPQEADLYVLHQPPSFLSGFLLSLVNGENQQKTEKDVRVFSLKSCLVILCCLVNYPKFSGVK